MPALPSGTHIAFDPAAIFSLLEGPHTVDKVVQLMLIRNWADMQYLLEIIQLVPIEEADETTLPILLSDDSLQAPEGHVMRPTDMSVPEYLHSLEVSKLKADHEALVAELNGRAKDHFAFLLERVQQTQKLLLEMNVEGSHWGHHLANGGLS
ncbi:MULTISPECIES: hypothetical protein [Deefgea]|uniref:Uncharacterized protein n=1 Tax=Deefgea chitinilytica TaxID=570276 RepID=A0ABS2C8S8_9NEIS|nr:MULTISPECIES: hypothetical protein [Deefgea]MBM5570556.1 hypothetical protein [Deefgea chitinilytica]MBM9887785.1 hypothetical protein [Deefgea sp. CFH1-16]